MVKNAGSKNKRGRLMKNMKSPNSGLSDSVLEISNVHSYKGLFVKMMHAIFGTIMTTQYLIICDTKI